MIKRTEQRIQVEAVRKIIKRTEQRIQVVAVRKMIKRTEQRIQVEAVRKIIKRTEQRIQFVNSGVTYFTSSSHGLFLRSYLNNCFRFSSDSFWAVSIKIFQTNQQETSYQWVKDQCHKFN